jgi:hypothetical protein
MVEGNEAIYRKHGNILQYELFRNGFKSACNKYDSLHSELYSHLEPALLIFSISYNEAALDDSRSQNSLRYQVHYSGEQGSHIQARLGRHRL